MLHRISMNVPQRVVSAVQTGRHDKPMLQAASHPPSHKTRGQGTHFSGTGEENQRPGHPPSYRFYLLDEAGPVRVNEGWGKISFRDRAA
jgi:hypothetical protein